MRWDWIFLLFNWGIDNNPKWKVREAAYAVRRCKNSILLFMGAINCPYRPHLETHFPNLVCLPAAYRSTNHVCSCESCAFLNPPWTINKHPSLLIAVWARRGCQTGNKYDDRDSASWNRCWIWWAKLGFLIPSFNSSSSHHWMNLVFLGSSSRLVFCISLCCFTFKPLNLADC